MDVSQAAAAIRKVVKFEVGDVRPILGGWAYWTFEVDSEWVFRFPRTDHVALAAESEQRLLPALAAHVDFEVPVPRWSGVCGGRPFFGYRKLPGRPLRASDVEREPAVVERLAAMLRRIHSFDVDTAKRLLRVEGSVLGWHRRYQDLRAAAVPQVVDLLDPHTASLIEKGFSSLLDGRLVFTPTLIHRDLGTDHILVDEATARPVGIIDFEDADVGDPAIDFVGFWITLGPERTQPLLDTYRGDLDANFIERIKTYWWIGSLHAVLYGLAQKDQTIMDDGVTGLRQRLGTLDS
jgi:aminoglycoside 2''-phosphotransferase